MLRHYRELKAWQKSYALCVEVYRVTGRFPKAEQYGLTAQMRRASVSIPSNIAEGFVRRTTADFLRSLYIAYGSVCELQTQALLAGTLGLLRPTDQEELLGAIGDVERLTKALIRSLERRRSTAGPLDRSTT